MQSKTPLAICGAKKRNGEPCQSKPMPNGRCRMHGGTSRIGIGSGTYKHGRYSTALPSRMQAAYQASLNDPELLDLNGSIALIDARLADLLTRVDTGESGAIWNELRKAYAELRNPNKAKAAEALNDIGMLINRGAGDSIAWAEVSRLLDDRRKHVETKQRLETQGERAVPVNELMTLMGAILNLINETVTDKQQRQIIADGFERLATPRTRQIQ
jgi:hypothetical protein